MNTTEKLFLSWLNLFYYQINIKLPALINRLVFTRYIMDEPLSKEQIENIFKEIDKDNDGFIT